MITRFLKSSTKKKIKFCNDFRNDHVKFFLQHRIQTSSGKYGILFRLRSFYSRSPSLYQIIRRLIVDESKNRSLKIKCSSLRDVTWSQLFFLSDRFNLLLFFICAAFRENLADKCSREFLDTVCSLCAVVLYFFSLCNVTVKKKILLLIPKSCRIYVFMIFFFIFTFLWSKYTEFQFTKSKNNKFVE